MVRRKRIRATVDELLRGCGIEEPPVKVHGVAKYLGLQVRAASTDDEMSGFLHRAAPGVPAVIGVNASHSMTRQRFTIAHEIGHFLLHAASEFHVDQRFIAFRRDSKSAEGSDWMEVEANVFAAELLMPHAFLRADLVELAQIDLEDQTEVAELAERYKVSQQAMTFRLANLGYVQA